MFTGIVEELGTVVAVDRGQASARVTVQAGVALDGTRPGDSIAVNGCCLTVTTITGDTWSADVMAETLARTTLGDAAPGDAVNLERAATVGSRLGGHLVQGHVDGVGEVVSRTPGEGWDLVEITVPDGLGRYLVEKGSVAVDGVSLTLVTAGEDRFTVSLIPETLARTTLGSRAAGDRVNLETDVIAKHVARLVAPYTGGDR